MSKTKLPRYLLRISIISLVLLVAASLFLPYGAAELRRSLHLQRLSSQLSSNSDGMAREIVKLSNEISGLQMRLNERKNKTKADMVEFTRIAGRFDLRLIGVSSRGGQAKTKESARSRTLVFRGSIQSLLDALHYMEEEVSVAIEGITLVPSSEPSNQVELSLQLKDEVGLDEI